MIMRPNVNLFALLLLNSLALAVSLFWQWTWTWPGIVAGEAGVRFACSAQCPLQKVVCQSEFSRRLA